jgi:hypothetical protein
MSAIVSSKSAVRERARQQPVDFADELTVRRTSNDDTAGYTRLDASV